MKEVDKAIEGLAILVQEMARGKSLENPDMVKALAMLVEARAKHL